MESEGRIMAFKDLSSLPRLYGSDIMTNFNKLLSGTSDPLDLEADDFDVNGFINIGMPTELTISGGVVNATKSRHQIDTEADAAADDLDTINGGTTGDILILNSAGGGRVPTLKDSTGNLYLSGDFALSSSEDFIMLMASGSDWFELSRSDNA